MILVTSSISAQLMVVAYIGQVRANEFRGDRQTFGGQLGGMKAGFTLLTDFSHLTAMDSDCAPEIGRWMELVGKSGIGRVIRVIPDPTKDIGMSILSAFHYPPQAQSLTCRNMIEAGEELTRGPA